MNQDIYKIYRTRDKNIIFTSEEQFEEFKHTFVVQSYDIDDCVRYEDIKLSKGDIFWYICLHDDGYSITKSNYENLEKKNTCHVVGKSIVMFLYAESLEEALKIARTYKKVIKTHKLIEENGNEFIVDFNEAYFKVIKEIKK